MPETPAAAKPTVKDTVVSVVIALTFAFIFRAFVVEAFIIPTGSMAPTLMGAHVQAHSEWTGYDWPIGPEDYNPRNPAIPLSVQDLAATDPLSGRQAPSARMPTLAGDRILVLKYLYSVFDPARYDVIVFKNPVEPTENFIKRLIGLPNEQIALVDGDVFARPADLARVEAGADTSSGVNPWKGAGWQIQRKSERVQRQLWQTVFDSDYTPLEASADRRRWFKPPWIGGDGWEIFDTRVYSFTGSGASQLEYDPLAIEPSAGARVGPFELVDQYAYNDNDSPSSIQNGIFPVSDLAASFGIEPEGEGMTIAAELTARGHEFRGEIRGRDVVLSMRPIGGDSWTLIGSGELRGPLPAGKVTNVEFWHADQALWMFVGGRRVAHGEYDWSPAERIEGAMGTPLDILLPDNDPRQPLVRAQVLRDTSRYITPSFRWTFEGPPFRLHRVAMSRDVHYQATSYGYVAPNQPHPRRNDPALATHPDNCPILGPDQFFACGDNSPASSDSRLWTTPDPWVQEIDATLGIVPRELLIGKAFFVYFPSLMHGKRVPMIDFGNMRFIR